MDEAKGSVNEKKLLDDVFCLGNEVAAVISVLGLVRSSVILVGL